MRAAALEIVRKALLELREGGVTLHADCRTRGRDGPAAVFEARQICYGHKVDAGTCEFRHKPDPVGAMNARLGYWKHVQVFSHRFCVAPMMEWIEKANSSDT